MIIGKQLESLTTSLRDSIQKILNGKQPVGCETLVLPIAGTVVSLGFIPAGATSATLCLESAVAPTTTPVVLGARYCVGSPSFINISTISGTAGTVTVTTVGNHNLTTNQLVSISGVSVAGYNTSTDVAVTVTNSTTFTYANATTGAATGGVVSPSIIPTAGAYNGPGKAGMPMYDNTCISLQGPDALKQFRAINIDTSNARAVKVTYFK
jgi:hypothetical protein